MAVAVISIEVDRKGGAVIKQTAAELNVLDVAASKVKGALSNIFQGIGQGIGQAVFTQATSAITSMAGAITNSVTKVIDLGSSLTDLSARTGVSVEGLQRLEFAAKMSGGSLADVTTAIGKMQKGITEGDEVFRQLGLSLEGLRKLNPEQQFTAVAESIRKIQDPAQQTTAALAAFGKGALALLPAIKAGFVDVGKEAERLGLIMSTNTAAAADELGDKLGVLGTMWDALTRNIGAVIVSSQSVHTLIDGLINVLGVLSAAVHDNSGAMRSFVDSAVVFVADALVTLIDAIQLSVDAWDSLKLVWASVTSGAASLGIALIQLGNVLYQGDAKVVAEGKAQILLLQGLKKAAESDAAAVVKASAQKADAIGKVRSAMAKLAADVKAASGKTFAATKTGGGVLGVLGLSDKELKKAEEGAKKLKKIQDDILKENQKYIGELAAQINKTDINAHAEQALQRIKNALDSETSAAKQAADAIEEGRKATDRGAASALKLKEAWLTVADAVQGLGFEIGGVFGGIVGTIGTVIQAFGEWGSAIDARTQQLDKLKLAASAIGTAASIVAQSKEDPNAFSRAAKGAVKGAAVGAQTGQWYGVVIGAVIGAAIGIFSGPKWAGAAKVAANVFGAEVSKELSKAIFATQKSLGISSEAASLLHITDAMGELGMSAQAAGPLMFRLLEGIRNGSVPAAEGIKELGSAFSIAVDEANRGAGAFDKLTSQLIQSARATGIEVPEMVARVKEGIAQAVGGVGGIVEGIQIVSTQDAVNQATIFSGVFWAAVAENGLIEAATAMQPAFQKMQESLAAAGIDESAIASILAPVTAAMSILGNETAKAAAAGIQGLDEVLKGLSQSAYLSADSFSAIQGQAQTAFNQLISSGVDSHTALLTIAPLLGDIQLAASQFGLTVDANTSGLIAQAEASGIAFSTDPMDRVVTVLEAIAKVLGAVLPAETSTAADALATVGDAGEAAGVHMEAGLTTGAASGSAAVVAGADVAAAAFGVIGPAADQAGAEMAAALGSGADSATQAIAEMAAEGSAQLGGMLANWQEAASKGIHVPVTFSGSPPSFENLPPESLPPPGSEVPEYAAGGYVSQPTLAIVGESGPEYIVPANRMPGGNTTSTYNITVIESKTPRETADAVFYAIQNREGQIAQLNLDQRG